MVDTWLITGCSSGLGKNLATVALEQGKQVVVTARGVEKLAGFAGAWPQTALILPLDVNDAASVREAADAAIDHFGKIDVLVNNAGYCLRGAVEECTMDEIQKEFDTNFFGTVRTIQAVLPHMRKARHGMIINFSSIAALSTSEGSAFYGAAKCAVEGMSDGLRKEVAPLGIKVMVVEPGPFKTDFFYRSIDVNKNDIADYADTAGKRKVRLKNLEESGLTGWGDVRKAAKVIIRAAESPEPPFRLLLGSLAVRMGEKFAADRAAEVETWKWLSVQTDMEEMQ